MKHLLKNFLHWGMLMITKPKIDIYVMLQTLLFSMQNGKNISNGLKILCNTATKNYEKKIYTQIYNDIKDGLTFSKALKRQKLTSKDIIEFIAI